MERLQKLPGREKQNEKTSQEKDGVYFMRTNIQQNNEKQLWDVFNTIREVEATPRYLKTALQLRPVFHQKDERVESHNGETKKFSIRKPSKPFTEAQDGYGNSNY